MKLKLASLISIPTLAIGMIPISTLVSCNNDKRVKVIVDTDVGNDCDDIAALSVLGNAYKKGMVDIKAVTVCNKYMPSFYTTDILLEEYGIDCPMGFDPDGEAYIWEGHDYAQAVADLWEARSEKDETRIHPAVEVLRKALADADRNGYKIKLITLGMLNDIKDLLDSPADSISSKDGRTLFEENVSEMVLMGGRFDDQKYAEFNIVKEIDAAQAVINTTSVPKTFCSWEVGDPVQTGQKFKKYTNSPQYVAYDTYTEGSISRSSWDPLTMYVALTSDCAYSENGIVYVTEEGYTKFAPNPAGINRYVQIYPDLAEIAGKLETWYTPYPLPN